MGLGDCIRCVKYLLIVFNLIFWLIGLGILGIGVWLFVDKTWAPSNIEGLKYVGIFFIVVGSFIAILGFLGCCGALSENRCLLVVFFILLLVVFLCLIAAGIAIIVLKDGFVNDVEKMIGDRFTRRNDTKETDNNDIQSMFGCCGGFKAERTYTDVNQTIPSSCGPNTTTSYVGCPDRIGANLEKLGLSAVIAIFVTSFVAVLGMVFSTMLCCAINDLY